MADQNNMSTETRANNREMIGSESFTGHDMLRDIGTMMDIRDKNRPFKASFILKPPTDENQIRQFISNGADTASPTNQSEGDLTLHDFELYKKSLEVFGVDQLSAESAKQELQSAYSSSSPEEKRKKEARIVELIEALSSKGKQK